MGNHGTQNENEFGSLFDFFMSRAYECHVALLIFAAFMSAALTGISGFELFPDQGPSIILACVVLPTTFIVPWVISWICLYSSARHHHEEWLQEQRESKLARTLLKKKILRNEIRIKRAKESKGHSERG